MSSTAPKMIKLTQIEYHPNGMDRAFNTTAVLWMKADSIEAILHDPDNGRQNESRIYTAKNSYWVVESPKKIKALICEGELVKEEKR